MHLFLDMYQSSKRCMSDGLSHYRLSLIRNLKFYFQANSFLVWLPLQDHFFFTIRRYLSPGVLIQAPSQAYFKFEWIKCKYDIFMSSLHRLSKYDINRYVLRSTDSLILFVTRNICLVNKRNLLLHLCLILIRDESVLSHHQGISLISTPCVLLRVINCRF